MKLTSDELLRLWERGDDFSIAAYRAFGKASWITARSDDFTEQHYQALKLMRNALHDGRYIGIGFPNPRRHGDAALQVPKEAWTQDEADNFGQGIGPSVGGYWRFEGLYFCDIRIAASSHHLTKSGGRPSYKTFFSRAAQSLVEKGLVNTSAKQNSYTEHLRAEAIAIFPMHKHKMENASERVILKYCSTFFNDLKEREK